MSKDIILHTLRLSMLFEGVAPEELKLIADAGRLLRIPAGEYVYRQGDDGDLFYSIAEGEAELFVSREGETISLGRIGAGGHFGETGILLGKPRSVSVKAATNLALICYDKESFRQILLENTHVRSRLDLALAQRLRQAFAEQGGNAAPSTATVLCERDPAKVRLTSTVLAWASVHDSSAAVRTRGAIRSFAANDEPFALSGETGSGKVIISRQVHQESARRHQPYIEVDLRDHQESDFHRKLVGAERSAFPFAPSRQYGLLDQARGGTIVFCHAELMPEALQRTLLRILETETFTRADGGKPIALQARLAFMFRSDPAGLEADGRVVPELLSVWKRQHFRVPALREHKRDLPRLVDHYVQWFGREYGKDVRGVSPETLGILMHYDWPGNLTELSSVIQRAVMLSRGEEILPEQILLGLPKIEGKWEYNVLRIAWVRRLVSSRAYPLAPQVAVAAFMVATLSALLLGPSEPSRNIGLVMSWSIGWPLLFFSFFFLARVWCSVCPLAIPGAILQRSVRPERMLPQWVKRASGWIMAGLAVLVLWVEVVWNAYDNPWLTASIILAIAVGSLITSLFYSRRAWCRYLCPLGAVNAIFAMPAVVELRANRDVCLNRCRTHACFAGGQASAGCPMLRHPYQVDNNRDCTLCGSCVKGCGNHSIHLNLRIAPQELWSVREPRLEDSLLVLALGGILFPFARQEEFRQLVEFARGELTACGLTLPVPILGSILFLLSIAILSGGYALMVRLQTALLQVNRRELFSRLGYAFIPLVLGGYLAVHLEFFVADAPLMLRPLVGLMDGWIVVGARLMSEDSTLMLQSLTIVGALMASLVATHRIVRRLTDSDAVPARKLLIPYVFLAGLAIGYRMVM